MFQSIFKFGITYNKRKSTSLQDVADRLLLRQDQTALGGACVDRRDENDGVARLNEVAHEGAVFGNAVCGEVDDGLAEVLDACLRFSVGLHDGDAVGAHARHEGFVGRVEVALVDDEDGGCAELAHVFDKVALTLIEVPGVGDDKRDVDPFEHGPGAFDSGESESMIFFKSAGAKKDRTSMLIRSCRRSSPEDCFPLYHIADQAIRVIFTFQCWCG